MLDERGRRAERRRCEGSLFEFFARAWREIDPAPFVENWHMRVVADQLEALARGETRGPEKETKEDRQEQHQHERAFGPFVSPANFGRLGESGDLITQPQRANPLATGLLQNHISLLYK
jgi:hypothetical protein